MGPLTLPSGGPIYVDANALIYSVERAEPYHGLLAPMWEEARAGRFTLASSELVALETLIKPLRDGNARLEMLFGPSLPLRRWISSPRPWQFGKTPPVSAPRRDWQPPTHSPAATALGAGRAAFITNDTDFRRVGGLPVVVLDDLVEAEAET